MDVFYRGTYSKYQILEMAFQDLKGVLRVVRGQHTYPNQVMTCNSMRSILRHEDIEWDVKFYIPYPKPNIRVVGELVLSPTSYTSIFCSIHPNEVWVKGSFFMVPHEKYTIYISPFDDDIIRAPSSLHLQQHPWLHYDDTHVHGCTYDVHLSDLMLEELHPTLGCRDI